MSLSALREWIWEQRERHGNDLVALSPAFDLILNKIDGLAGAPASEELRKANAKISRLEEALRRYGDRTRMAWAPVELQADIDAALAATPEPTADRGGAEVAVRNPSVAEYMAHWEDRALKAEADNASMRELLQILAPACDPWEQTP